MVLWFSLYCSPQILCTFLSLFFPCLLWGLPSIHPWIGTAQGSVLNLFPFNILGSIFISRFYLSCFCPQIRISSFRPFSELQVLVFSGLLLSLSRFLWVPSNQHVQSQACLSLPALLHAFLPFQIQISPQVVPVLLSYIFISLLSASCSRYLLSGLLYQAPN